MSGGEGTPPPPRSTSAVTLKLPPYWPSDPLVWFAQVDAQFGTRHITSQKTKFDHVVASLAPEYAQEVRDLILEPPAENPYTALKAALVDRTAASEQRRLQQLFNAEELGDRKPSQVLRRMQQLLGDKAGSTDASFLRELFLQRLPPSVRMVLASSDTTDLQKLAQLADKIVEVTVPTVSAVTARPHTSELEQLRGEITELKRMMETLSGTGFRHRRRSVSRGRTPSSRAHTPSNNTDDATDNLCWYHRRFGVQAKKCQSPCSKSQGNDQASH